jgi:hypothetical protein
MEYLASKIMKYASELPEGALLCAKTLLHFGSRAGLDQALSRLARRGKLMRVSCGLYVHPIETRYGLRAPETGKVVEGIANLRGESVASHGAAEANALGLTTQVPLRPVYLTSGRNRQLRLGRLAVELKNAPSWQLVNPGQPSGRAIRALAWLGRAHTAKALAVLKERLPEAELQELAAKRAILPEWLAEIVSKELVSDG